jgi:hypothetical protein
MVGSHVIFQIMDYLLKLIGICLKTLGLFMTYNDQA